MDRGFQLHDRHRRGASAAGAAGDDLPAAERKTLETGIVYLRPAASTDVVGSAPSHVWSEVGPYTEGTGLFSRRRYTVSCVRWWQVCSTRRQKTQMRCRVRPKKGTSCIHHSAVCGAKKASRGRASSSMRWMYALSSGVLGSTSPAGGSGVPTNSPKNLRSESNWCFRISATVDDLGCGLKFTSSWAKLRQTEITLSVSLA